ncbi:MAG: response regulator [Thermoanaerobaculia bacterium]|nr:MAG: response regulator [Thermoanaerobaculia bacterium]MBZ0102472.1 response regulator [Thermoanaerobaculia bacterium]
MTRTILLADDSVTIQKVVELTFLDEDFEVITVGDGAEAIGRLEAARPDLVIADVHMPGADGYEVAETVGRVLPGTPVILLVGTFEVFDSERAAKAGATEYLKKPFDSQELLRRVKELLAAAPAVTPRFEAPAAPAWELEAPAFEPAVELPEFPLEPEAPVASYEPPALAAVPEPAPAAAPAIAASSGALSDADVDRIARRVVELIGGDVVRDVAWEVVPDLAEVLLQARIRELEASVE